jgi:hypothetical protein
MAAKRRKASKPRKPRDLPVSTGKARGVRGGVTRTTLTSLAPPAPPGGPIPIPYPN